MNGIPLRAAALIAACAATPLAAQTSAYEYQGVVEIFTNDWFGMPVGDRYDRWRTGGFQVSAFWAPDWTGTLPTRPFELIEARARAEIIAPDNLANPAPGDRRYAPALYFGATTHFDFRGLEVALGADVAILGEQTGLMGLHDSIHRTFGGSDVDLSNFMIEDGIYLNVTGEAARSYDLGTSSLRPFAEVQTGVETLARVGADIRFGAFDPESFLIRDPITGQRVVAIAGGTVGGWSFAAGADVAYVHDTELLPSIGPDHEDMRYRVRGAAHYGIGPADFSYGVTYLSEEFVGQDQGQLVGSISLMLRF
ncbi:DUF2219 family protein [Rhodobacterales bacterium HKCCE4037]|nr:DUF2219 family protein [Rhodobacterales bacterium HKCCE4037]